MNKPLNIYMGCVRGASEEGAVLIFADTARAAKKLAYSTLDGWFSVDFIEVAAYRIRVHDYLYQQADKQKLEQREPHVIETPECCRSCEMWGISELSSEGFCDECQAEVGLTKVCSG